MTTNFDIKFPFDESVSHFSYFLDTAITSIKRCVRPLVGWSIGCLVVGWLDRWFIRHAGVTEVMQQIWDGLAAYYCCILYAPM